MSAKTKPAANGKSVASVAPVAMSPLDVLTLAEAATYLQLSEEVVRAEAEGSRLPGRCLGGEWRFNRGGLLAWLNPAPKPAPTPWPPPAPFGPWTPEAEREAEAEIARLAAARKGKQKRSRARTRAE